MYYTIGGVLSERYTPSSKSYSVQRRFQQLKFWYPCQNACVDLPQCIYLCCNGWREIRKWLCWHVDWSNFLFKSYLAIIFCELIWEDKNFNTMRVEEHSFISSSHFLLCSYFQGRIIGGHVKENKVSMGHNWAAWILLLQCDYKHPKVLFE